MVSRVRSLLVSVVVLLSFANAEANPQEAGAQPAQQAPAQQTSAQQTETANEQPAPAPEAVSAQPKPEQDSAQLRAERGTAQAAQPQAPTATDSSAQKTWVQKVGARLRPRVMMYYDRGLVAESTSDFAHRFGLNLSLGVSIQPTLIATVALSVERELGAPIEYFAASNTRLSLTKMFNFPKIGWLSPTIFGQLPTNDDDREFLSYRGTLGASVNFFNDQVFKFKGNIHALGGGVNIVVARHMFQYTTALGTGGAGNPAALNTTWVLGFGANLVYTLYQRLSFILSFRDNLNWNPQGRGEDRYEVAGGVQFNGPYGIRAGLWLATADRTTDYDRVSSNIKLYRTDGTSLLFSLGYAPLFETVTQ